MHRPGVSIAAQATIAAAPWEVFALLGDLERHRELTDHGMRILGLQGPPGRPTGGLVELRGPGGLTRVARTRVQGAEPHSRLWGTAETSDGARALLEWRVRPQGDRTHVEVRLDVHAVTWTDRTLLHLGGRAWLSARLRAALDRLAQNATRSEENPAAALAS
jgi:hypothetical protein